MNLNIDQLDGEERRKINALLRERNDTDKNKGVEYIFKQSDEREDFLLGKKIDINKMAKDDKAMMGESEIEFQERMEKRKLMQKMCEDPMAIIQLNEQQARKVMLEKQRVHQKLSKRNQSKFQRNNHVSSSDSESSDDCERKLRELLNKMENDEDDKIGDILKQVNSTEGSDIKRHRDKSSELRRSQPSIRKRSSSNYRKNKRNSRSRSPPNSKSRNRRDKKHNRSESGNERYHRNHHSKNHKSRRSQSHSPPIRIKPHLRGHKPNHISKSKFTQEEKERRLQEMKDNAREIGATIDNLDKRFKKQEDIEETNMEKHLKRSEEFMFNEIVKMNNTQSSLHRNIHEKSKYNQVKKMFGR